MAGVHDLREVGSRQKGPRKCRIRRLKKKTTSQLIDCRHSCIDGFPFESYQLLPLKVLSTLFSFYLLNSLSYAPISLFLSPVPPNEGSFASCNPKTPNPKPQNPFLKLKRLLK
jgi:hypothetical protein